jgi:diaminopimelate epimerase
MSGAGNDFLVLDAGAWAALPADRGRWVRGVCRRGVSVGADGVLIVFPEDAGRVRVSFFNPDGGEAFCGNGSRCAARFAATRGLAASPSMILATSIGDVPAVVTAETVSLTLPAPEDRGELVLLVPAGEFHARFILAGVPHVVVPVSGLGSYPIERVGPELRRHPALGPDGANVNLVETDASGRVHVRTFERGVESETLACGTGAVAVACATRRGAGGTVTVVPRSGLPLSVTLPGPDSPGVARLTGDARFVFEGVLDAEAIVGSP